MGAYTAVFGKCTLIKIGDQSLLKLNMVREGVD